MGAKNSISTSPPVLLKLMVVSLMVLQNLSSDLQHLTWEFINCSYGSMQKKDT